MGANNKNRFGAEIPFSRADIAVGKIGIEDYNKLDDTEKNKCLDRNYIWKAESAKKAVQELGKSRYLAWWQNRTRKMLYSRPHAFNVTDEMKDAYVKMVSDIRDKVMSASVPEHVTANGKTMLLSEYIMATYPEREYRRVAISEYLLHDLGIARITYAADQEKYGMTDMEIATMQAESSVTYALNIPAPVDNFGCVGEVSCAVRTDHSETRGDVKYLEIKYTYGSFYLYPKPFDFDGMKPGMYTIVNTRDRSVYETNVAKEDVKEKTAEYKQVFISSMVEKSATGSKSSTSRKKKFVPVQLKNVRQQNGYELSEDATGDMYMGTFYFKGGEHGNWMNDEDRRQSMNMGFTAFKNLSKILDISDADVSFRNQMSIAFGSRGHGSAAAHYEPGADVINLTKMNGAGCLAHEWGHALDYHIAKTFGISGFASEYGFCAKFPDSFTNLMLVLKGCREYQLGSSYFDHHAQKESNGYWASNVEMFARAFDCYIEDKLKENGITDDYLSAHADSFSMENKDGKMMNAYPVGDERARLNACFDIMINDLKNSGTVHGRSIPAGIKIA